MKLNLQQRISLLGYLPKEWKFETLVILKDIIKKIEITQDEIAKYEIKSEGNNILWNVEGVKSELELEFTELETSEIKKALKKASDDERLRMEDLPLYEFFV